MKHPTKMKAWWVVLAIAIILVAIFLSSGCVTIKNYPTVKATDTVYIEKKCICFGWRGVDPGFYQWPSYPYELPKVGIDILGIPDTGYLRGKTLGSYYPDTTMITVDSSYKGKAIKAQQMTNAKQ